MTSRGYDRDRDGHILVWWTKWSLLGFALTVGLLAWLTHEADVRAQRNLPSSRQGGVTSP